MHANNLETEMSSRFGKNKLHILLAIISILFREKEMKRKVHLHARNMFSFQQGQITAVQTLQ